MSSAEEISVAVPEELIDTVARRVLEFLDERDKASGREPWIGVAEAAEHLHCKPQRIYALVHQGRLRPERDGSRLLFKRSELDAWLQSGSGIQRRFIRHDGIRERR
jgi:excisionase family DNA binding protein